MLKRILFLLVLVYSLTTPSKAYEAHNIQTEVYQPESLPTLKKESTIIPSEEMCATATKNAEKTYGIKENLLQTIAIVESGRWDKTTNKRISWPWTVHANGKGYYFTTKEQAITAVKAMQKKGQTNIDVGCMQINLKYHGTAFNTLEEAFDPEKNVAYSAQFLQQLYKRTNQNWKKTAMYYHSKDKRKGINYKNRLEKHYTQYISPSTLQTSLF